MSKLVDIVLLNITDVPYTVRGEVVGIRINGYNMPSGAWCKYSTSPTEDVPAKFVHIRKARARRYLLVVPVERVVSVDGKPLRGEVWP